jgi:hypothetical protein
VSISVKIFIVVNNEIISALEAVSLRLKKREKTQEPHRQPRPCGNS